jgi:hypothetical protein
MMNRKGVVTTLLLLLLPVVADATNLRGRIDGMHAYSYAPFPLPNAQVQLVAPTARGPQLIYTYYTGSDGMYYIPNIRPGNYVLVVNGALQFPLAVFNVPLQDIAPILFSY